jgi:predicted peptidase
MRSLSLLTLLPFVLLAFAARARSQSPATLLEKRVYKDAAGKSLPYRLLKPDDYDAKIEYPLVLFLHGAGERGNDNDKQLIHGIPSFASPENRKAYPCFLIAPQCPSGAKWVEVDWGAATHKTPKEPSEPMRLTFELIDSLRKEFSIDPKRIYVTGLSMGGYGTWDALARRPDLFAAGAPICGGGDENDAKTLAKIPIWTFHGAKDTAVPVARSRNMIAAIKKEGGDPRYTEYPKEGHASWVPAYRDPELFRWLFAQKRP